MMNNSSVVPSTKEPPAACKTAPPDQITAVSFSVSYGVVLILAVVGNSLVINYARTNRRIKSNVFNLFLICMATADLIDVLTVAPLHWIYFFFVNKWVAGVFGELSCKLLYFLVDVSIFASVLTLVAITLDRYFAVCKMNYTPLSRVKTRFIIAGIWACSCVLSSVQLYKFKIIEFKGQAYCVSFWNNNNHEKERQSVKYEMTIKFAVSYGIPLLLMIVLYTLIIRQLRKRLDSCVVEENSELQQQIAQQNRPLVEMFITLVIIFAICWFPVHVNHMLIAFDLQTYQCLPTALPLFFYLLAHANAAINPLLYFIFISGFRKELKRKTNLFWAWVTGREGSSNPTHSRQTFFRSRMTALKKRKHTHREDCDHQHATADQNPKPPSPPGDLIESTNENTAKNRGLFRESELSLSGINLTTPHPLDGERGLGTERINRSLQKNSTRESICSTRSLNVDSYVNRAFDTDNNNRNVKSASLPWKLSTLV